MRIVDLLAKDSICLNGKVSDKKGAIDKMVSLMEKGGHLSNAGAYKQAVLKREAEGTTGIGEGIAIPHAKTNAVSSPGLAAMTLPEGVDFDSLDGHPVRLIFMIAAPDTKDNVHLEVLSRLSVLLMNQQFREHLIHAKSPEAFLKVIDLAEMSNQETAEADGAVTAEADKSGTDKSAGARAAKAGYQILAVTACPTGIAHTYMAQEALEQQARKMGYRRIKMWRWPGLTENRSFRQGLPTAYTSRRSSSRGLSMARRRCIIIEAMMANRPMAKAAIRVKVLDMAFISI